VVALAVRLIFGRSDRTVPDAESAVQSSVATGDGVIGGAHLIRDRLSWLRFLGFDLGAATPDANTIRLCREKLTEAGALDMLFANFDRQIKERGYLVQRDDLDESACCLTRRCSRTVTAFDVLP
jgi:hypothetical protein